MNTPKPTPPDAPQGAHKAVDRVFTPKPLPMCTPKGKTPSEAPNDLPRVKHHRMWIRAQRELYKQGALKATEEYMPLCSNCHCAGNSECGELPCGDDCSLDPDTMLCPCCAQESRPMGDAEWDAEVGQMDMLTGKLMESDWTLAELKETP